LGILAAGCEGADKASCGVGRQYTGSAGKITNCQTGVFATYVSRHGHTFIDWALYLPKAWTDDPARMAAAHVPDKTALATKPALARAMMAAIRHRANSAPVRQTIPGILAACRSSSGGPFRKSAA
jgi:SRSO17 transposase